jgi:hypothetical protein
MKNLRRIAVSALIVAGGAELVVASGASAGLTPSGRGPRAAENLPITAAVRTSILDGADKSHDLPIGSYIGLQAGTAYYALDEATSTYWAGASLIPNPKSQEAQVSVQDDGGYVIFERHAGGAWSAFNDGLVGVEGSTCASAHIVIPPAVLAVWHWAPGSCKPPVESPPTTTLPPTAVGELAAAKVQWLAGANASSASADLYLQRTAKLLLKAAGLSDGSGNVVDTKAAKALEQMASLPDAMLTPAQGAELRADTEYGNEFFGTNGAWGTSTPSRTVAAFTATLQQETRIGTLNAVPALAAVPDAVVTCPVLASLALNKGFGCRISSVKTGGYTMIGEITAADAVTYVVNVVKGAPIYPCAGELDASEEAALHALGGHCS